MKKKTIKTVLNKAGIKTPNPFATPKVVKDILSLSKLIKLSKGFGLSTKQAERTKALLERNNVDTIQQYLELKKERQKFYRYNRALEKASQNFEEIVKLSDSLRKKNPFQKYDLKPNSLEDLISLNESLLNKLNSENLTVSGKYNKLQITAELMLQEAQEFYSSDQWQDIRGDETFYGTGFSPLRSVYAISNFLDIVEQQGYKLTKKAQQIIEPYFRSDNKTFMLDPIGSFKQIIKLWGEI